MSILFSEFNRISATGFGSLTGTPVSWDPVRNRFQLNRKCLSVGGILIFRMFTALLWKVTCKISSNTNSNKDPYINISFALACGCFTLLLFVAKITRKPDVFLEFFNKFANFHHRHKVKIDPKQERHLRKAYLACSTVRISSSLGMSLTTGLASVFDPEFPTNMFSYYPERLLVSFLNEIGKGFLNCLIRGFVFVWTRTCNFMAVALFIKAMNILLSSVVIGCTGLAIEILKFQQSANDHQFRKNDLWIFQYKQIQILCKLFNQLVSSILFTLSVTMMTCQIVFGSSLVMSKGHQQQIFITCFNATCALNGMFGLFFLFGFCANVYSTSEECLKNLRGRVDTLIIGGCFREVRRHRRLLRSMPVLKVEFGAANYIDTLTPVIFQNFTTLRLIDWLLVAKK